MNWSSFGGIITLTSGFGWFLSTAVLSSFDKLLLKCCSKYKPTRSGASSLNYSLSSLSKEGSKSCGSTYCASERVSLSRSVLSSLCRFAESLLWKPLLCRILPCRDVHFFQEGACPWYVSGTSAPRHFWWPHQKTGSLFTSASELVLILCTTHYTTKAHICNGIQVGRNMCNILKSVHL